jgi:hypothetical protein
MIAPTLDLTRIQSLLSALDSLLALYPQLHNGNGNRWINNLSELDQLTGDIDDDTTQRDE